MIVKRTVKIDVDKFKVGDIIKFKLVDGEKVQAMAVEQTPDGMLFVLVDCLAKEYPMFNNIYNIDKTDISYAISDLRKALNGEILERFPKKIKDHMVAVNAEGDVIRIPTEYEIFGENVYGQEESKLAKRWKPMKKKRNRIAFQGKEGALEWYWLMNRYKDYAYYFAFVYNYGRAHHGYASNSLGVRPVFCLRLDNHNYWRKNNDKN